MENKSPESPILCTAGCGFYGNKTFDDMCSKCFKEKNPQESKKRKHVRTPTPEPIPFEHVNSKQTPAQENKPTTPAQENKSTAPAQENKGKCFDCRKKVPLAKQATNKCRCGFVFCDTHKYPDRHDCKIDFAKRDKEILAKNNPKLHERPKGGRSFQRIDSL
ncbi:unnamed protein product [Rhizopus stolonifer]